MNIKSRKEKKKFKRATFYLNWRRPHSFEKIPKDSTIRDRKRKRNLDSGL